MKPTNPNLPFFQFKFEGVDKVFDSLPPNYNCSFTCTDNFQYAGANVVITVFDTNWNTFTDIINGPINMSYRFGYVDHMSPWIDAMVVNLAPTFQVDGVGVQISGISKGLMQLSMRKEIGPLVRDTGPTFGRYATRTSSTWNSLINKYFGAQGSQAVEVMNAESSGNPDATNHYTQGGIVYTVRGLFQISDINAPELIQAGIITNAAELYDPEKNVQAASYIYRRRGWSPWTASKSRWIATAAFTGEQSPYAERTPSQKIEDAVISICENLIRDGTIKGYEVCKTKNVLSYDDLYSAKLIDKPITKVPMSDKDVLDYLASKAISTNGDGNFIWRIGLNPNVLYFGPAARPPSENIIVSSSSQLPSQRPSLDTSIVNTYIFMRDKRSTVISFAPNFDNFISYLSSRHRGASFDSITGEKLESSKDTKNTTDKVRANPAENLPTISSNPFNSPLTRPSTAPTQEILDMEVTAGLERMLASGCTATLEVLGDPDIQCQTFIKVLVLDKRGVPYWGSGVYLINQVEHSISLGDYKSTMQLTSLGTSIYGNSPAVGKEVT